MKSSTRLVLACLLTFLLLSALPLSCRVMAQTYQQYRVVSATSYTVVKADCGRRIKFTSNSAVAVTVPRAGSSTGRLPVGCNLYIYVAGDGTVTLTPTTSTIAGGATLALTKGVHVTVSSDGTNYDVTQQDLTDAQRTMLAGGSSVSATELGYLDGVTSAIQTQLDAKVTVSTTQSVTGAKTFDPAKLIVGGTGTLPTVVPQALAVDTDDKKLYFGVDDTVDFWGEVFVNGLSGPIGVANGGSGVATITGIVKGNGTSPFSAATAGTDYVSPSSAESLTNKTFSAEGTGNILTTVEKVWLGAAGCANTTAASFWDLPTSTPAVAACVTGTNTQKGVLQFADTSGGFSAQTNFLLPADFTGAIDVRIIWSTSATSGNVKWSVASISTAIDASETDDPAFNSYSTVTTAAPGSANRLQTSSITGLTITGVAVSELLHLKIFRDGNDGSDTASATVNLIGVEVTLRRAQ